MLKKLAALPLVAFIVIIEPLRAIAQQAAPQPPQDYLPPHSYFAHGPWDMWHGWHFWWMFPLMMLFMIFIFAVIFFIARGLYGHGYHHWGPRSRMWGESESLGVANTQRTLCARRNPKGRVRGEKGCDPLGWIALAYKFRLVSRHDFGISVRCNGKTVTRAHASCSFNPTL